MFSKKEINKIPTSTGIYIFKDFLEKIIYVGKALNLRERVRSYFTKQTNLKTKLLINKINSVEFIQVSSEVEALLLEANLVKKYLPKYNINLRDDKSFLYIIITNEEFPRILSFKKNDQQNIVKYKYGPFPNTQGVKDVLKTIRKIFPFCTQSPKINKPCFYSHINLCNPCPAVIKKQEQKLYSLNKAIYRKNISYIKKFLDGKLPQLINLFRKQMKQYSRQKQFEKAQETYRIIQQLEYISRPYNKISSFLENPNFLENRAESILSSFLALLKPYFPKLTNLAKIEAIDISHIQGKEAAGSLVVFINGQKDSKLYRHFKINSSYPDDIYMIEEVLLRRLRHTEWRYPNLFIIDGGKSQVNKASGIISQFVQIPVIGIAKRLETLIILHDTKFVEINLPVDSEVLQFIQEIRDEAHRFVQQYHRLLRKKLIQTI